MNRGLQTTILATDDESRTPKHNFSYTELLRAVPVWKTGIALNIIGPNEEVFEQSPIYYQIIQMLVLFFQK